MSQEREWGTSGTIISEAVAPDGQQTAIAVYYHTHWDREWYEPFRTYQVRLAEVVDQVIHLLESNTLPCFTLDGQTVVLEDYLELRPNQANRLYALIRAGRLSIGPWYVMPDEFLVNGESLIRNLMRGIRTSQSLGCNLFTGYLPDTFGHSADMPALFQQMGIDSAVVWRGVHPSQSLFRWKSPSGAAVKTLHLSDGYFQMMLQDWTATEQQQAAALQGLMAKLKASQASSVPPLMPIGGDHLGPLPVSTYQRFKAACPNIIETTPAAYLAHVSDTVPLVTYEGELVENQGSFLLPGVYSSRMYLKQENRKLEHALIHRLEPLLAMAQLLLPKEPDLRHPAEELELVWKTLILNHPHDSICGCSVDPVHRENEVRFEQVWQLYEALCCRAEKALAQQLASENHWLFFNTGDRPYSGVVPVIENCLLDQPATPLTQLQSEETCLQDAYLTDSQRIPLSHLTQTRREGWLWVENIPPFGLLSVPKQATTLPASDVLCYVDTDGLENEFYRIELKGKTNLSVTYKPTGQCWDNLLHFTLQVDRGDSYNSAPVPGGAVKAAELTGLRVKQIGPLVASWELIHVFPQVPMNLVTTVSLQANSPLLTFQTVFINRESSAKLQVCFQTGQPISQVVAESHLSMVKRQYDPNYRIQDHMPVGKGAELKTNTGPIQRFMSANGLSWFTEGLTEYEVAGSQLALTLMRSFGSLSSADTGVRGAQAGPPFATPEGQCLERTFWCRYAWCPTPPQPADLYSLAGRFYGNVWGISGLAQGQPISETGSATNNLLQFESNPLSVLACYWLPNRGLVFRVLNHSNAPVRVDFSLGFSAKAIREVNFLEEPLQLLSDSWLTLAPFEVRTYLFEV